VRVAPSIIAADFSQFQKELKNVEEAGADLLHLDIMDGVFVPNITFGPLIVEAINTITDVELDAHLMIVHPEKYIERFIDAGADWISLHVEAADNVEQCISLIKNHNKKAGIVVSPETPFMSLSPYCEKLDFLLIMSVHPGFYGQKFIPEMLHKIKEAKDYIVKHRLRCLLQVDGGIHSGNAHDVAQAGADIVVAGAGVFKSKNYKKAIEELQCLKD
jgi:ribulose-phosphate 3-epimerase